MRITLKPFPAAPAWHRLPRTFGFCLGALLLLPCVGLAQMCPAPASFWEERDDGETSSCEPVEGESLSCGACLAGDGGDGKGMMRVRVQSLLVSLALSDTPLAYRPAKGPAVPLTFTYSQRESYQPVQFHYGNLGHRWTLSAIGYVVDDPSRPGHQVQRYRAGGGTRRFRDQDFDPATGRFAPDGRDGSVLARLAGEPARYERRHLDGGVDTYGHGDGQTAWPRRIFLTERRDAAGNILTFHYDGHNRLTAMTDATGRKTLLEYRHNDPLKITALQDPNGRRARIEYDDRGRLASITDAVGMVSRVSYRGKGTFIERLETAYGATRFQTGETPEARWLEITDPLGRTERIEARAPAPGIGDTEARAPRDVGVINKNLSQRNTFWWDAEALARHRGDYTKARILHWREEAGVAVGVIESLKEPLENRQWYVYPAGGHTAGACARPSAWARALPAGDTQARRYAYDARGQGIRRIDPLGRALEIDYAANGIDPARVRQKTATGYDTLAEITWNAQHRPLTLKDAAGQTTRYAWNEAGQLTGRTNALGGESRIEYDALGQLTKILDAQGRPYASFTHDAAGNLAGETDSEGHTLQHDYDGLNRRTKTTHPDGTTTEYTWDKLDLVRIKDRAGQTTHYRYDAAGQLTEVRDALRAIQLGYNRAGRLTSLTDGNGQTTRWQRDLQGRVIGKYTPDSVKLFYEYDAAGRLVKRLDTLKQETILVRGRDDRVTGIAYANTRQRMLSASIEWDAHYPRPSARRDAFGDTVYRYVPPGRPGALRLAGVQNPGQPDTVYRYDALGRLTGWRAGAVGEDYVFDALGRVAANRNAALGEFAYGYLGQTGQLTRAKLGGSSIERGYVYEPNTGDRRLKAIRHPAGVRGYAYATRADGLITRQEETLPGQNRTWAYGYDDLGRLTSAKRGDGRDYRYVLDEADNLRVVGQPEGEQLYYHGAGNKIAQAPYRYDADGNRIEDAKHTYRWDAANRLVEIGYKADPQKGSWFWYDGQGRRVLSIEKDGQRRTQTRYAWCGNRVCAARNEKDQPLAHYFHEGVWRPLEKRREYYARDHLGSVRDVLDEQGQVIARYDYSPYGKLINDPPTPPEFGYAGMQYHAPSGLYLTKYRVYDPEAGRWLSRDPIGEAGGINLYGYVGGNPISFIDPLGLHTEIIAWNAFPVSIRHPSTLESAFGHMSVNINGKNYSWGPSGWDRTYPTAEGYAQRQRENGRVVDENGVIGRGVSINITVEQEQNIEACLIKREGSYNWLNNNCTDPIIGCMESVLDGNVSNSLIPANVLNDVRNSKYYNSSIEYRR
jgi:RHS repeat-associated protein